MVKLVTTKQVRTRLTLQDDEGVNEAIKSSINAATSALSSVLNTNFVKASTEDVFFIDSNIETIVAGHYKLRTANGFIRPSPAVKVYVGDTLEAAIASADIIVPGRIDYEKGYVLVPESLASQFVRVTYDYGFLDTDVVPLWLQEVMISYTAKVLATQQIADGKPELSQMYNLLKDHGSTIIASKLRVSSISINPMV